MISKQTLICLLFFTPPHAEAAPPQWRTYVNVRFSYIACYPAALLTPQGEAPDSDGEAFLGAQGVKLLVYGGFNLEKIDLPTALAATERRLRAHGATVTYQYLARKSFTITATQGNSIIYEKRLAAGLAFQTMLLRYPATQRAIFDPLIAHMAHCFSSLPNPPGQ